MAGVSGKGSRAKAIREFKATGNKAMASGAFQKAMRQYTKALELDPGNAVLYSNRSAAHFNLRQFAESLEDAESAILCDNMWWKAYKRKGLSLIHMQRYEEAIEALEEGLKIVGKNAEMEKNLEFARACQEQAQNLYILPEPHMMQRLESVPVFIVTDDVGQPFFVTYEDGQQVCTFYFDKTDANATLDWIKSENPDLGDSARVIHITLNQAFNLAQETQKQYYEETTRAAAEIDRKAAEEATKAASKKGAAVNLAHDVDGSDEDTEAAENAKDSEAKADKLLSSTADTMISSTLEASKATESATSAEKDSECEATDTVNITNVASATTDSESGEKQSVIEDLPSAASEKKHADHSCGKVASVDESEVAAQGEGEDKCNADATSKVDQNGDRADDSIIDESTPLSFQFRPELRQVQVAVDLLNKHPDPPVKPILRDPPSVRKAKAEAAAAAAAEGAKEQNEKPQQREVSTESNEDAEIESGGGDGVSGVQVGEKGGKETISGTRDDQRKRATDNSERASRDVVEDVKESMSKAVSGAEDCSSAKGGELQDTLKDISNGKSEAADGKGEAADGKGGVQGDSNASAKGDTKESVDDEDDVELTVDNFNGIPIFQAKGLTLLQNNKQLIPLFFSKWDLEEAWQQLTQSHAIDVPGECEVDVGTLEDVLRRMSESKTDEFESVFFVPSRESMKAIGAKFPLDDLTTAKPAQKPAVKKAQFSRAKQVAARGGTPDEVRAAIKEDLELHVERQRMAEIIAQIEQARSTAGGSAMNSAVEGRRSGSGRIDRTMRRNAQRQERKQAAKNGAKGVSKEKTTVTSRSGVSTSQSAGKSSGEKKPSASGSASKTPDAQVANPSVHPTEVA